MVEKCAYRKCREKLTPGYDEIITEGGDLFHYECFVSMKRIHMDKLEKKNESGEITKREALEYADARELVKKMHSLKERHYGSSGRRAIEGCKSLLGPYFFESDDGTAQMLDGSISLKLPRRKPMTRLQYVEGCKMLAANPTIDVTLLDTLDRLRGRVLEELPSSKGQGLEQQWKRLEGFVEEMHDENLSEFFRQEYVKAHPGGEGETAQLQAAEEVKALPEQNEKKKKHRRK